MKKAIFQKILIEQSMLSDQDANGHVWWNRFEEFIRSIPEEQLTEEKKTELILRKFHGFTKEQWENEIVKQYPYSEIPYLVEMVWKMAQGKDYQEAIQPGYEYEMFFDDDGPISIHGWYPIATSRIKHPEKIEEYIQKGLLRRIV